MTDAEIIKLAEETFSEEVIQDVKDRAKRMTKRSAEVYQVAIDNIAKFGKPKELMDLVETLGVMANLADMLISKLGDAGQIVPERDKPRLYVTMDLQLRGIRKTLDEAEQANNQNMF